MPELAEVEYYCKQWNPGLGRPVRAVLVHERAKSWLFPHRWENGGRTTCWRLIGKS